MEKTRKANKWKVEGRLKVGAVCFPMDIRCVYWGKHGVGKYGEVANSDKEMTFRRQDWVEI